MLVTRGDAELAEHLAQLVGDGVLADEQSRADIAVRQALACESGDLSLLRSELVAGLDCAFADALAGGQEFSLGPRGEGVSAHAGEHLKRGAKLFSGVEAALNAEEAAAAELAALAPPMAA